jgi:hypothetical protein
MSTLSVSLTPGYLLQDGEKLTAAIARAIAQPTITLEGDIGSASIGDGSVTTVKLADGALSADTTGRAKMEDGFLTLTKIASGIFTADTAGRAPFAAGWLSLALVGSGIFTATTAGRAPFADGVMTAAELQPDAYWYAVSTGSGSAYVVAFSPTLDSYVSPAYTNYWDGLEVAFKAVANSAAGATLDAGLGVKGIYRQDGTAILANDILLNSIAQVRYNSSFNSGAGGWQLLTPPTGASGQFTSAEQSVQSGHTYAIAHGLGATPRRVRWVMVCKTAEYNYSVGDEIDVATLQNSGNQATFTTYGANATNVFLVTRSGVNINVFDYSTHNQTVAITMANWRFKCYADL